MTRIHPNVRAVAGDVVAVGVGVVAAYVVSLVFLYRRAFPPQPEPRNDGRRDPYV